jgi:hypothetical protein
VGLVDPFGMFALESEGKRCARQARITIRSNETFKLGVSIYSNETRKGDLQEWQWATMQCLRS